MKSLFGRVLFSLAVALLFTLPSTAQTVEKNKYPYIEVTPFGVKAGIDFPQDYLVTMTDELVTQLEESEKFRQVLRHGETASGAAAPTLRLLGTVTEFQRGNRAVRYLVGFGAGKTKIVAHVTFIDRDTGAVLVEADVDGTVILGGLIKAESIGATRGLAKEVAKIARQRFFD